MTLDYETCWTLVGFCYFNHLLCSKKSSRLRVKNNSVARVSSVDPPTLSPLTVPKWWRWKQRHRQCLFAELVCGLHRAVIFPRWRIKQRAPSELCREPPVSSAVRLFLSLRDWKCGDCTVSGVRPVLGQFKCSAHAFLNASVSYCQTLLSTYKQGQEKSVICICSVCSCWLWPRVQCGLCRPTVVLNLPVPLVGPSPSSYPLLASCTLWSS